MRGPSARVEHCGMGKLGGLVRPEIPVRNQRHFGVLHRIPDRLSDGTDHHRMEKIMTTMHTPVDNGVNVDALLGVRAALADTPEIAQFQWRGNGSLVGGTHRRSTPGTPQFQGRATVSWVGGTLSRSPVDTFYGFGEQQRHKTTFTHDIDHPLAFAGQDNGISPVEYVLVALGGCLTAGIASIAQHRKIQLRSVQATVEADEDIHGILGADPEIRNGFTGVRVSYKIEADASAEQIKALVAQSQKRSAVYDILTNPTNVTVELS